MNFKITLSFLIYLIVLASITWLYKWQQISPILIVPYKVQTDWSYEPIGCWNSQSMDSNLSTNCQLDDSMDNILLFGDSHASQLVLGFENLLKTTQAPSSKKIILLTSSLMNGHWPSPHFFDSSQVKFISSVLAETSKNDVIIFTVSSQHVKDSVYGNLKQKGRLSISLAKLLASILYTQPINGKIILMLDTPHLKNDVARICYREEGYKNKLCKLNYDDYMLQNSYLIEAYDYLKTLPINPSNEPIVLDPTPSFCNLKECSLFDESGFMLIDGNHIKMSVSHKLVKELFIGVI